MIKVSRNLQGQHSNLPLKRLFFLLKIDNFWQPRANPLNKTIDNMYHIAALNYLFRLIAFQRHSVQQKLCKSPLQHTESGCRVFWGFFHLEVRSWRATWSRHGSICSSSLLRFRPASIEKLRHFINVCPLFLAWRSPLMEAAEHRRSSNIPLSLRARVRPGSWEEHQCDGNHWSHLFSLNAGASWRLQRLSGKTSHWITILIALLRSSVINLSPSHFIK